MRQLISKLGAALPGHAPGPGTSTMPKPLSEVARHFATIRAYTASIGLMNALKLRCYDLANRSGVMPLPSLLNFTLSNALHPVKMRTGESSDRRVLHQVFVQEEYEPLALGHPTAIVDLGANVGYSSAYFLSKYPTARVVAVGAYRDGREWATQVRPAAEGEVAEVEGYDVATLMGLTGATAIDLLKIDIEGSERDLFERNTDAWLPSIRNLCVELHDDHSASAFFRALSRYSFDYSRSGELTVCRNVRFSSLSS